MGRQQSPEERAKRSASLKAYYATHRHNSADRVISEETRAKLSEAKRTWWADPAIKECMLAALKEHPRTPKQREHMSQLLKGRIFSAESLAKMSMSHKGYKPTPESVEKTAAANRGKKRTPDARERMVKGLQESYKRLSPEEKQERREAVRRGWAKKTTEEKRATCAQRRKRWTANGGSKLENAIADHLTAQEVNFTRNKRLGRWIVDFFLPDFNTVIEVDGTYWHNLPEPKIRDARKDAWARTQNLQLFRILEADVRLLGPEACVRKVLMAISSCP